MCFTMDGSRINSTSRKVFIQLSKSDCWIESSKCHGPKCCVFYLLIFEAIYMYN